MRSLHLSQVRAYCRLDNLDMLHEDQLCFELPLICVQWTGCRLAVKSTGRNSPSIIHCSLLESKMFTQFCINSQGANSIQVEVTDSH